MTKKVKPVRYPSISSKSSSEFYIQHKNINEFYFFVFGLAFKADDFQSAINKRLAELHADKEKKEYFSEQSKKQSLELIMMKKHMDVFSEIIYIRHVENYITYISGIMHQIFVAKPNNLRSSEHITLKEALSQESIDNLVLYVAEKKVSELSYLSLIELNKFFLDRFGMPLAGSDDLQQLFIAIEVRNLAVHNRSIMNSRYTTRLKISQENIGKKRIIEYDELNELSLLLFRCVKSIDKEIKDKFKIKGIRTKTISKTGNKNDL